MTVCARLTRRRARPHAVRQVAPGCAPVPLVDTERVFLCVVPIPSTGACLIPATGSHASHPLLTPSCAYTLPHESNRYRMCLHASALACVLPCPIHYLCSLQSPAYAYTLPYVSGHCRMSCVCTLPHVPIYLCSLKIPSCDRLRRLHTTCVHHISPPPVCARYPPHQCATVCDEGDGRGRKEREAPVTRVKGKEWGGEGREWKAGRSDEMGREAQRGRERSKGRRKGGTKREKGGRSQCD